MHVAVKAFFRALFNLPPTAEYLGWYGERLTTKILNRLDRAGVSGFVLRNVYIPTKDGETTEIDVLYLTLKGVFVLESKNYSGWIFGNDQERNWTQSLAGGRNKSRFPNPVWQNATHVRWLAKYLPEGVPLFPIVVFSQRCTLKKLTLSSPDVVVIKRDRLFQTIKAIWKSAPYALAPPQLNALYQRLAPLAQVSDADKKAHVERLNAKYRNAPVPDRPSPIPERPSPIPGRPSPVPGRPSSIPGRPSSIPGRPSSIPGRPSPIPGRPSPVPVPPSQKK
ncbi:MAG: NERD domain-containing protein [Thermoguttaceae bacterium]|nr:NERD domain-containing protein [Thermoguttaceae bacterium]